LGLRTSAGKVSDGFFEYIPGRIRNFTCGWSENLLSCAGREVLIKSIAQAVPTYPMSCFKLPSPICKKMTTYISNYWWGSSIDNHKIHWLKLEKLTEPKLEGAWVFEIWSSSIRICWGSKVGDSSFVRRRFARGF
jgi:hypothetical protein